ncbi:MAG: lysine--tRNA ligase [Desulfurococcales archaeon]|nr:lysine--tRNA ligase [Desulfurococcales archaeon]
MMTSKHWVDILAEELAGKLAERKKEVYIFNGGLSVSGVQHIGRLRGEIILPEVLRRTLESKGFKVKQLLTLYTQDAWKGKKPQLEAFDNPQEARRYKGWPLIKVPDPRGCHNNWVEHYWSDFGPYIKEFTDGKVEVVTTTELYNGKMKEFVLETLQKREQVRKIINRYRGRNKYPEGWIPFEPICSNCGRIDRTVAVAYDEIRGLIEYYCRACNHRGKARLEEGKLNWRIEWTGVWKVLEVDFEPYGKDHATPGGSRDSCKELAAIVYKFNPPEGEWYEWVSLRIGGKEADMTSSGFVGITPKEWLDIAHPQILRFIYVSTNPKRRVVIDLQEIPRYYNDYYRAERVYFGLESTGNEGGDGVLARSYELSHPDRPPEKMPIQIPYLHVALLVQNLPRDNIFEHALLRLKRTSHVSELGDYSKAWLAGLVVKALNWVDTYAPESLKFKVPREPPMEVYKEVKHRSELRVLAEKLARLESWDEGAIKEAMIEVGGEMSSNVRREFYKDFYLAILGKPQGPRAAPLLSVLDKEMVIDRLKLAARGEEQ